jgi:type IV pilus assembly protein PilM
MFLSNSSNYPIGLDISDLSLKLIQLKKVRDKIRIQALNKVDLPAGYFDNGEIKNQQGIIKSIEKLLGDAKYGKISGNEIIACLPETKTFIKLIEVPRISGNINQIIESELEKHIPMPINEIYYDWQLIEDHPEKQLILIGAASRKIVNSYTELLDKAKLSIVALEIEPVALSRSLLAEENPNFKGQSTKNYGIIDIGANRSNLTLYSRNAILFSFSIPLSGRNITERIAKSLNIEETQAEKAKIICGLDENKAQGIIKNLLYEMIKNLVGKIKEAIIFYETHFPGRGPIDEFLICGGGANIKNIEKIISDYISIKVSRGNVFINLDKDQEKIQQFFSETHALEKNNGITNSKGKNKIIQDSSSNYATAIGLALRGLINEKNYL